MLIPKILLSPTAIEGGGQGTGTATANASTSTARETADEGGGSSGEELYEDVNEPAEGAAATATGGEAATATEGQEGGEGTTGEGETNEGVTQPTVGATFTSDQVAEILGKVGLRQQAQPVQPTKQPHEDWTDEQFNQTFNVYQPTNEVLIGLRSEDPNIQMKAFIAMRDGITKQALTMAEYRREISHEKFVKEHVAPMQEYVTREQHSRAKETFYKSNKDLTKYEPIVNSVADSLTASGQLQGKSVPEIHKLVAAGAREILKGAGINLAAAPAAGTGAGGTTTRTQVAGNSQPAKRKMSTLTGGGQSGGGGGTAGGPKGPPGSEVFD